LVIVVELRAMEAGLGVPRSVLALAGAFTWVGTGAGGIAVGWFAGMLYDRFGYYAPAFGSSLLFNILNLRLVGFLVMRQTRWGFRLGEAAA
jgi:hypothetical protein